MFAIRLVLSRKGVDSAAGRCASALLDGAPVSIPIPTRQPTPTTYADLTEPLRTLAADLSRGRLAGDVPCHLDPDIRADALARARPPGWRGALGQVSAAATHLRNQGVGPGDLFLFWGLYRDVQRADGRWRYAGPPRHLLYGWLEIAERWDLREDWQAPLARHSWLADHPHVRPGWSGRNDLYIATDRLTLRPDLPGAGVFRRAVPLTRPDATGCTAWSLPDFFRTTGLTYHAPAAWSAAGLRAASQGQEFVADIGSRSDARDWLDGVFEAASPASVPPPSAPPPHGAPSTAAPSP